MWIIMLKKLGICIILLLHSGIKDISAKPPVRIVGGVDATIEEFPSLVSIQSTGVGHACGGTLITNKHVLTAAHCVVWKPENQSVLLLPASLFTLYAGSNSSNSSDNPLEVETVHVHELYAGDSSTDYHDDIAILTLKEAIEPGPTRRPIALAIKNPEPGEIGNITRWGYVTSNGPPSVILKKALTKIKDNDKCWAISDTQLCAVIGHGIGFCDGDSGGPLIINNAIVGIIANSEGCGSGLRDVFMRVFSYLTWIRNSY